MTRLSRARRLLVIVASASGLAIASVDARADDKATCAEAYTAGQAQRDSGAFSRARESFALCAKPVCKEWMVAECVRWLDELERRQPTVVLFAEGERGELVDIVRVEIADGKALALELDGRAIPLDPGRHTLTFVTRDGKSASVNKVIAEGQKAVPIKVTFETKVGPPVPATSPAGSSQSPPPCALSPKGTAWRTTGWILGGVGLVGLGIGATFGLVALDKKSNGNCDARDVCDFGTSSGIRQAATLSDVGFIAGSVLLAGGAALLLFGPSANSPARAGVRVAPAVGAAGGGLVLGGRLP